MDHKHTNKLRKMANNLKYFFLALISVVFVFGCNPVKQAAKKQASAYAKFEKLDRKCKRDSITKLVPMQWSLATYPIEATNTVTTKYLPGKPRIVPGETVYLPYDCDSALRAQLASGGKDVKIIRVPVPVYKQVDTMAIIRETVKEDTRKLRLCEAETRRWLDSASTYKIKHSEAKEAQRIAERKATKRGWIIGGLISAISILIFLIIGGIVGRISNPISWFKK